MDLNWSTPPSSLPAPRQIPASLTPLALAPLPYHRWPATAAARLAVARRRHTAAARLAARHRHAAAARLATVVVAVVMVVAFVAMVVARVAAIYIYLYLSTHPVS